jgi:hypothetical protein
MRSHPLADSHSKEVELVKLIGDIFNQFSQLSIEPIQPLTSIPPSPIQHHKHSAVDTAQSPTDIEEDDTNSS